MVATRTLVTGLLIAATALVMVQSSCTGGIITAGSSGTLYYGSWSTWGNYSGAGSNLVAGGTIPLYVAAPAPLPAYTPTPPQAAPSQPAQTNGLFGSSSQPSSVIVAAASPVPVAVAASMIVAPPAPSVTLPPVAASTPSTHYDAFINFGTAPNADQAMLTTGSAQSWTTSPSLAQAFGHVPSAAELTNFSQTVLSHVQSTFASSGLSITATTDPTAQAGHMLSVVSGLSALSSPSAIGVTNVGHNGFDFIDKLSYANSPDQLEWAVAHNVAHELMHAFGGEHHTTAEGNNLDAPISDWSVLTDPNTKFSAASVAEMTYNLRQGGLGLKYGIGNQQLNADGQEITGQPVPEPATLLTWAAIAGAALLVRRRASLSQAAA